MAPNFFVLLPISNIHNILPCPQRNQWRKHLCVRPFRSLAYLGVSLSRTLGFIYHGKPVSEWAFDQVTWWILSGSSLWPRNYSSYEQTFRSKPAANTAIIRVFTWVLANIDTCYGLIGASYCVFYINWFVASNQFRQLSVLWRRHSKLSYGMLTSPQ